MKMPDAALTGVALRREALVARAQRERADLCDRLRRLEAPAAVAERAWSAVRFVRERPVIVAACASALVVLGRRRLLPVAGGALSLWRLYRILTAGAGKP